MRILKVTQSYEPFLEKGGPTVKVPALARGLTRRGHRVTVLTADLGLRGGDCGPAPERSRWGWRMERNGIETIYLRTRGRYRTLTLNPAVISFCAGSLEKFDLAHIYGLYDLLGAPAGYFCRRLGKPYLVEPMGMYLPIMRSFWLKQLYNRLLGNRLLHGAQRVIATSEQEKQELFEAGIPEAKICVRRNGIEIPASLPKRGSFRQRLGISPETKLILFLGRLISKKSPDLLMEAYARWRARFAESKASVLVLAGPHEGDGYLANLETLAKRLGIRGSVLFTGALYDDAKWAAYQDADVFVLPSVNENFGNTAAEAVGCGTPVIVTVRCGIATLIDGRAGITVPHRAEPLADALGRILEDEPLRQRLRTGCGEVIRGLSWEEPLTQMESLYQYIIGEAASR
jgi:glycosyltransferase involved in cell wall biosynthesis